MRELTTRGFAPKEKAKMINYGQLRPFQMQGKKPEKSASASPTTPKV